MIRSRPDPFACYHFGGPYFSHITMRPTSLKGCKVLIVENDQLNAQLMMFQLEDEGCEFVGPAATVAKAIELYQQHSPHVVILDYRLHGETIEPVADLLEADGTPYVLVTGALPAQFSQRFPSGKSLIKPFRAPDLIAILNKSLAESR